MLGKSTALDQLSAAQAVAESKESGAAMSWKSAVDWHSSRNAALLRPISSSSRTTATPCEFIALLNGFGASPQIPAVGKVEQQQQQWLQLAIQ